MLAALWMAPSGFGAEPGTAAYGNISAGSLTNVGEQEDIDKLSEEFKFNETFVARVEALKNEEGYIHWRRVRGDGNCAYRAVAYNYLEQIVGASDHDRLRWSNSLLEKLRTANFLHASDQAAHAELLKFVEEIAEGRVSPDELLRAIQPNDSVLDKALMRAARKLTGMFLLEFADVIEKNGELGMTFTDLISATNGVTVPEYVNDDVEPDGVEAEGAALTALPQALGVGLRIALMDPQDKAPQSQAACFLEHNVKADPKAVDKQDRVEAGLPGGRALTHVQLRPGHYDIIYLQQDPDLPAAEMGTMSNPAPILESSVILCTGWRCPSPGQLLRKSGQRKGEKGSYVLEAVLPVKTARHLRDARDVALQWFGCY